MSLASTTTAVRDALQRPRYEVIPLKAVVDGVAAHVPLDIPLTVTASPQLGIATTLEVTGWLRARGYAVTPHLSSRLVTSDGELKGIVERLATAGVRDVFIVGGDVDVPAGPYPDAHSLLVAMDEIGHPFEEIGITGYPTSHPVIPDDVLIQAMWDKRHYATYIVSQVCFSHQPIVQWVARVRRRNVGLPIYIGLPGVAPRHKLLRIAQRIGVAESGRFLRHHMDWIWRLGLPGAYSPRRLLDGLAPGLANPQWGIAGFHIYTFNEFERTEAWRRATLARLEEGLHGPGVVPQPPEPR